MDKEKEIKKDPTKKAKSLENPPSETDPFGSYTGKPVDEDEVPTQDQDDL